MKRIVVFFLLAICANSAFGGEIIPLGRRMKKFSIPRILVGRIILSDQTSRGEAYGKIVQGYQDWDNASVMGILSHTFEDRGDQQFAISQDGESTINWINDSGIGYAGHAWVYGIAGAAWRTDETDIRFNNDSCFDFGICPYQPQGANEYKYDLDTVIHHEVGHEHGWHHCLSTIRSPGDCSWNSSVMTGHTAPPPCHHITMGGVDIQRAAEMYNENPYEASEPGNDTFQDSPVELGILNADGYLEFQQDYYFQGINDMDCYSWQATDSYPNQYVQIVVSGYGAPYTFVAAQLWRNGVDLGTRVADYEGNYIYFDVDADEGTYQMRVWNSNDEGMGTQYGIMISDFGLVASTPDVLPLRPSSVAIKVFGNNVIIPYLERNGILGIYDAAGRLVQSVDVAAGRSMVYTPNGLHSGVYFVGLRGNYQTSSAKLVVVR
jgi:hypothetical protein